MDGTTVTSGPQLIEDVRNAPDDVPSLNASLIEVPMLLYGRRDSYSQWLSQLVKPEYTMDLLGLDNEYHVGAIRSRLTQNLAATFNEVREELVRSLDASIPVYCDGR